MAEDTSYLWKRGNTYSATLEVPKALQDVLGTRRFVKGLGTSNLSEANRLKLPYVLEWKQRIAQARRQGDDPHAALLLEAMNLRAAHAAPGSAVDHEELRGLILEMTRAIKERDGKEQADRFLAVATEEATLVQETYELWLQQFDGTEQTKIQHEAAVKRFLKWAKSTETIEAVTRKRAGEYVNTLLASSGLSKRTIQRHCSSLSSLWVWYGARGFTEQENPWRGHGLSSKKGQSAYRHAYSDDMILKLLKADYGHRYAQDIPDLIRLALLTGARLEVFCAMKKSAIEKREDGYWATIEGDKTVAGNRVVPLHSAAVAIIERRLEGSGEFLFAGLEPGGPDKKRSWYVGKMFRYHRLKLTKVKGEDFHAFRNTFIAVMEGLEVAESTVKLLVGHKRQSMTYGHYSKGERVKLRSAIETLDYGPEVMKALLDGAK
jgi:integrase